MNQVKKTKFKLDRQNAQTVEELYNIQCSADKLRGCGWVAKAVRKIPKGSGFETSHSDYPYLWSGDMGI